MERLHLAGGSRASLRALIMSTIELGYGRGSIDFDYDAAQFDLLARPQSETTKATHVMSAVTRRTSPYCDALLPSSIKRSAKTICMKR